ncbi:ABC transporter substrate-binding protein [Cupriavidus sp. H18C1]|uniref:PaaI family thioesterase n=1 Tax=Cupriavidus sp. H18C1 TaxID=3241601 RepID=UPI003BB89C27
MSDRTMAASDAAVLPTDNPLLDDLGIRLVSVGDGRCVFELDLAPRHLNRQGSVQGGVVATMLDAACGYAGLPVGPDGALGHAATAMLSICYLSKASSGRLRAAATVTRAGNSLYFASAQLTSDAGVLIATAQGTFKRARPRLEN